jgi:hypothetical protein
MLLIELLRQHVCDQPKNNDPTEVDVDGDSDHSPDSETLRLRHERIPSSATPSRLTLNAHITNTVAFRNPPKRVSADTSCWRIHAALHNRRG